MKKITLIISLSIMIFTLNACSDVDEPVDIILSSETSEASLTFIPNAPVVGDEVTIQASEVEGYEFLRWIDPVAENEGIISKNRDYTFTAKEDRHFEAVYQPLDKVELSLESENEQAVLTATQDDIFEGDTITIEASIIEGYVFSHWEDNSDFLTNARIHTFTMDSDTTLHAVYEPKEEKSVTIDLLSFTPGASLTVKSPLPIALDQPVTIEASEVKGFEFAYWVDTDTGEALSSSKTFRFAPAGDVQYKAVYEQKPLSTKTVDFENLANEYTVDSDTIDLYFYESDVAYVDIVTYLNLIDGAIVRDQLTIDSDHDSIDMVYTVQNTSSVDGTVEETDVTFHLDTNTERLTVSHFYFFNGLSAGTSTAFGENLEVLSYTEEDREDVTIDLSDYDFDVKSINDELRIPFQLANLFFSGSMYDTYYNGNDIYGVDTYQLMDDNTPASTLRNSTYNDESMSMALKQATDNYLELSFDYFYGLKEVKGIQSYINVFEAYENELLASDRDHYHALWDLVLNQDDLHTSNIMNGFYETSINYEYTFDDLGPRTRNYYNFVGNPETEYYCADTDLELYSNNSVAKIKVNSFDENTLTAFEETMNTIDGLGSVNHVILDLSCNSGGVIGIMLQMLGYMTDEPIDFHQKNITDNSHTTTSYAIDIAARNYEWSILSSTATYSAANAMLSIADDMNLATIIGEKSSGGASSLTTNIMPSGTIMLMSSANVMTNNQFQSIEFGIEPEVALPFEQFSSEDALINAIN